MLNELFKNSYLDKLSNGLNDYELARDFRKLAVFKTRREVADILQISEKTIARYESPVNQAKIPFSYFMLLRFMAGDLSYFGNFWEGTRIEPVTKLLHSHFDKYKGFKPMDLNSQTNFIYQTASKATRETNARNNELILKVEALETHVQALLIRNERLESKLQLKKLLKDEIRKGKVLEFKRKSLY